MRKEAAPSHLLFVRRERESCGRSPGEIVVAYSQASYIFRLSSDRSLPILYADESHCLPSCPRSIPIEVSPASLAIYPIDERRNSS